MKSKSKKTIALFSSTVAVLAVSATAFWWFSWDSTDICLTENSGAEPMRNTFTHDPHALIKDAHTIAFQFTDWCNRELADSLNCRCKWDVDSLVFDGNVDLPWGDTVNGLWTVKSDKRWLEVPIQLVLAPVVQADDILCQTPNWSPSIIDSTTVSLEVHGEFDPTNLELTPGGLCVVVNIDGGDDKGQRRGWKWLKKLRSNH